MMILLRYLIKLVNVILSQDSLALLLLKQLIKATGISISFDASIMENRPQDVLQSLLF